MQAKTLQQYVDTIWDTSIIPTLQDFIRIPNKSSQYDPQWEKHGFMAQAVQLIVQWCRAQPIAGLTVEVVQIPGRTPLIYMEIPGKIDRTLLLYGHLDKQPEMTGWREGLGPWQPVIEGDKLYGRGGADDGYAVFASLTAINALQQQNIPHARCVVIIEASEESGSPDLPFYLEKLQARLGAPDLVICLDSGCGNYDQLWNTTSLRGLIDGTLRIELLKHGVHSGARSGIAASSFRVLRELLDRIENSKTGEILLPELRAKIPEQRIEQAKITAKMLGQQVIQAVPFLPGVQPVSQDIAELLLNVAWRPTLCVIGAAGLPALEDGGNVLRPYTSVKLSLRLPPTCDPAAAIQAVKKTLESDPPYGAKVTFEASSENAGWNAPPLAKWLEQACDAASENYFGKGMAYLGEGGSIPFMGMLGERYPQAQFLITGVLGPHSNAHGPNEFLHIPCGKKVTACVADVIAAHYRVQKTED